MVFSRGERGGGTFAPREDPPVGMDPAEIDQLLDALFSVMAEEAFGAFVDPPGDRFEHNGLFYSAEIALPIGLMTLLNRLKNGYYRQVLAFAGDVATLRDNAIAFNGAADEVAKAAVLVADTLLVRRPAGAPERSERVERWQRLQP